MKVLLINLITSIVFITTGCSINNNQLAHSLFNDQIYYKPTEVKTFDDILTSYNELYRAYINNQNILHTLENMNK